MTKIWKLYFLLIFQKKTNKKQALGTSKTRLPAIIRYILASDAENNIALASTVGAELF